MQTSLSPLQIKKLVDYLSQYSKAPISELKNVITQLDIVKKNKGNTLINQGEPIAYCYFIVEGCVRQFTIDEEGEEITVDFLCEHQADAIFDLPEMNTSSPYTFECMDDCILIAGDLNTEETLYEAYPFLKQLIMNMLQTFLSKRIDASVQHLSKSPLQRYQNLLQSHALILDLVPQHQIASYLGITPESLSRIKRRMSLNEQPNA